MHSNTTSIYVLPEVIGAARRHGLAQPGRAWYVLRHINTDRDGCVDWADAMEALARLCHWAERTVKHYLAKGEGIFWRLEQTQGANPRKMLRLRGVEAVLDALDVGRVGNRVPVPLSFFDNARGFNAGQYHAEVARHHRPISRAALAMITGISERAQRRHHKSKYGRRKGRSVTRRRVNRTPFSEDWRPKTPLYLIQHGQRVAVPRQTRQRPHRLPNKYEGTLQVMGVGMQARAHNRSLGPKTVDFSKGLRWFESVKPYVRAEQKGEASVHALLLKKRRKRCDMWEPASGAYVETLIAAREYAEAESFLKARGATHFGRAV